MTRVHAIRHDYLSIYVNSFAMLSRDGSACVLIDGGLAGGFDKIAGFMEGRETALLSTHGHWDHIGLNQEIREHGGRVLAHTGDRRFYEDYEWHWKALFGQFEQDIALPSARREAFERFIGRPCAIDEEVSDGDELKFGDLSFKVIHTPGHSKGSACYLESSGALFTGDTLMSGGFFTGIPQYSDFNAYMDSMRRLSVIDCEVVFSDHNPPMDGRLLRETALRSVDCATRIDKIVAEHIQSRPETTLGEIAALICERENKSPGAGACVTALAHLKARHHPLAARYDIDQ